MDDPFDSAGDTVDEFVRTTVAANEPCSALPDLDDIAHNVNHHRRKTRSGQPQNLESVTGNDDPDRWHKRLHSHVRSQMPLYLIVAVSHEEALMASTQTRK